MDRGLQICQTPYSAPVARSLIGQWHAEMVRRNREFVPERASMVAPGDFERPRGAFLVAFRDGEAIGCAGLRDLGNRVGEIKRVFVSPVARGRGLATALLVSLEELARLFGYRRLRLDTDGGEPAALALFRSLGYEPIEDYNGNPFASFWFQKRVRSAGESQPRSPTRPP